MSLDQILRVSDAKEQSNALNSFLDQSIPKANQDASILIAVFQKLISDDVPVQVRLCISTMRVLAVGV